jgi:hypothetical protein
VQGIQMNFIRRISFVHPVERTRKGRRNFRISGRQEFRFCARISAHPVFFIRSLWYAVHRIKLSIQLFLWQR